MAEAQFDQTTGEVFSSMPAEVAKAIICVKKQIKQLGVDERNQHGGYNFVSVDKFYERIGKLMADAGLALLIDESASEVRASERQRDDGKIPAPWLFVQYQLVFMHETGVMSAPLRRSCALPITGPQTYGAAQSYIEKQFLRQVFKVPTGEKDADDTPQSDGEAGAAPGTASTTRAPPRREQAAPAPSEAKVEADKRYREIRSMIDDAESVPQLAGLDQMPAWGACRNKIVESELAAGKDRTDAEKVADVAMANLASRADGRRRLLLGEVG